MRRIASLFKKDLTLGFQDVFILLEVGFAVILVLLLVFVVPEDIESESMVFIYDQTGVMQEFIESLDVETGEQIGETFTDSREAVIAGMEENRSAIGIIVSEGDDARYAVDLLKQPYTPEALVEYVRTDIEDLLSIIHPPAGIYPPDVYESVRIESLEEGLRDELPFNQLLMPTVLLFMVGILGLFVMVSLVGQERVDQTLRALRVAPANLWQFLVSKHLVVLVTGLMTFTILYIPMMGLRGYLSSLLIIVLTVVMGSSLGAILASFLDNPMEGIGWVVLLMIVLGLPAISLFAPTFSPGWIRLIPSYHTLFGLDAAMFPANNGHVVRQSAMVLAGVAIVLFIVSGLVFNARTRKEA